MTLNISEELEKALRQRAQQRQLSLDELVNHALNWYVQMDPELLDELDAWQEVRDEASGLIEEPSS